MTEIGMCCIIVDHMPGSKNGREIAPETSIETLQEDDTYSIGRGGEL